MYTRLRAKLAGVSPNQPKTPHRTIRIPDELWKAAQQKAADEGTDVSAVIRELLAEWVGEIPL